MKMGEVTGATEDLDPKIRKAMANLIDFKVENDMKEVLSAIKHMESRFESKFAHVDGKFSTVYWVIGLVVGVSTAFLAILLTAISFFKH